MQMNLETVYLTCAAVGGTVLVLQTVMLLLGGGDHDADAVHVEASEIGAANSGEVHTTDTGFGLFSVRTVSAFLTIFGLSGWACQSAGWGALPSVAVSLAAGFAMLLAVAWLFHAQKKLSSSGTVNPANAVGQVGHVYLRIPEKHTGKGKITLALQGRTVEFDAVTSGREIATGTEVRVARQVTQDTFEVEPV